MIFLLGTVSVYSRGSTNIPYSFQVLEVKFAFAAVVRLVNSVKFSIYSSFFILYLYRIWLKAIRMSDSLGVSIAMGIVKSIVCVYDVVTMPFYFMAQKPWEARSKSEKVKAQQVRDNDPYAPWTRLTHPAPHFIDECTTVPDLFARAVEAYQDRRCFGAREVFGEEDEVQPDGKTFRKLIMGDYKWYSYEEIDERIDVIGKGFLLSGVRPGSNVLIFAETRLEWMLCAQAIFRIGATVATLYATLGDEGIVHGINETEVTHVITNFDLLPKLQRLQSRLVSIYMQSVLKMNRLTSYLRFKVCFQF